MIKIAKKLSCLWQNKLSLKWKINKKFKVISKEIKRWTVIISVKFLSFLCGSLYWEDIFSDHLLWPIFLYTTHIVIQLTNSYLYLLWLHILCICTAKTSANLTIIYFIFSGMLQVKMSWTLCLESLESVNLNK